MVNGQQFRPMKLVHIWLFRPHLSPRALLRGGSAPFPLPVGEERGRASGGKVRVLIYVDAKVRNMSYEHNRSARCRPVGRAER